MGGMIRECALICSARASLLRPAVSVETAFVETKFNRMVPMSLFRELMRELTPARHDIGPHVVNVG
jgi:hypothetical protein